MNDIHTQAIKYLEQGLSVIPLQPRGKKPLIAWEKYQKQRATVEEINQWFEKWPDANIGIVTGKISGIIVVDVDSEDAMKLVQAKGGLIAPTVKTGKGYHLYCKYIGGVRNFQKRDDLKGIDLRAEGGYVVASPSVHESGHVYKRITEQGMPLADVPEWILAKDESDKTPLEELMKGVSETQRNDALVRLTGSWLGHGLDYDVCLKEALSWNQRNKPPLEESQVQKTVESLHKKHQKGLKDSLRNRPKVDETSFMVLKDGRIAEMLFDRSTGKLCFAVFDKTTGVVTEMDSLNDDGKIIMPFRTDPLITEETPSIWLPSNVSEYHSDRELFLEIKSFIHKYVVLSETFENLVALYAMFTWIFDNFNVLPYLRVLGDFGTGKSRFLFTIGLVCYKPMIAVAAMGEAPLFRLIQRFRGTLILDEANFKESETNTAIVQILNAGFEKKAPVLRCTGENFGIEQYQVYCPKIISSRARWTDTALESRCITWKSSTSDKAPLYLGSEFNREAQELRNKLLMFRFRNFGLKEIDSSKLNCHVEPRIKQILLPLLSMSDDEIIIKLINDLARQLNREIIEDRATRKEARILQVIKDVEDERTVKGEKIYLKEIEDKYNGQVTEKERITSQTIANACKKPELMIPLEKKDSKGKSIVCRPEQMTQLYKKYGIIE